MTPTLHPDFREFLFSLKRHRVRFVVVGAYVLASLGRPRYSDDLDIFVAASRENAQAIAEALREFGGFEEAEYVRTKRAADRPKDRADLALLEEAGLLDDID